MERTGMASKRVLGLLFVVILLAGAVDCKNGKKKSGKSGKSSKSVEPPRLSSERCVFQTDFGEFEIAFFPEIAPRTVQHIFKLCQMGGYITNHFSIVQKDYFVQIERIDPGRFAPLHPALEEEEFKTVPLETVSHVTHGPGVVTLVRGDGVDSGRSSLAFLLTEAPHLDGKFTILGNVTRGMGVLYEIEDVEVQRVGNNDRPVQRVPIHSTHWYSTNGGSTCDFSVSK